MPLKKIKVVVYMDSDHKKDITELVQKVVWSGKDGTPSRTLDVTFVETKQFGRVKIDVMGGTKCYFKYNDKELFRGVIRRVNPSSSKTASFKAYDEGWYLSNNEDAFSYKKKKADYIFKHICKKYGISIGSVTKCQKVISEISKHGKAWDIIQTALTKEFKHTGIRHAVTVSDGKINLTKRRENIVKWLLESDTNILSWSYTESIEKVKTRAKIYSSKSKKSTVVNDKALEKKIGIVQVFKAESDEKKKDKLKSLAKAILRESKKAEKKLTIKAIGLVSMHTGRGAYVIIPELDIKKTFYINQDTHIWEGNNYTMSLSMTKTTDLDY